MLIKNRPSPNHRMLCMSSTNKALSGIIWNEGKPISEAIWPCALGNCLGVLLNDLFLKGSTLLRTMIKENLRPLFLTMWNPYVVAVTTKIGTQH